MEAVILAGGQGTRLAPYTNGVPKALVSVCGRPVIEILLHRLKLAGVTKVHIAVSHLAYQIKSVLGDGERFGLQIVYSEESEPLSTVGPLTLIPSLPDEFLVANADVLTDLDLKLLYARHRESHCKLTVATYHRTERMDYGVLQAAGDGRVTAFSEKPEYRFSVSMGVYVFSRSVLEYVPRGARFGFDDLMLTLLKKNEPINTCPYEGFWLDIGRPDDYERANTTDSDSIRQLFSRSIKS